MDKSSKYYRSNIHIVKYPIVTEKSTRLLDNNQYTFMVDRFSNKSSIKIAIEYLFNVKVTKVNTCNLPKKQKRVGKYIGWKSQYKKAIITLSKDDIINVFAEN